MISFIQWLTELAAGPGSGMVPPKQDPTKVGGTNAFGDFNAPGSDELPPTKRYKMRMKKSKSK